MHDEDCRYLSVLNGDYGSFPDFLKKVGVELPHNVGLSDIVRWGWLVPMFRIEIPSRFIQSWENFPIYSQKGEFHSEDHWANSAWYLATHSFRVIHDGSDDWYLHPFDSNDPGSQEILTHAIPAGTGHPDPELVDHPRFKDAKVKPWIDFFAHWQAYQLKETLAAAELLPPILNTPNSKERISNAASHFESAKKWSDHRIASVQQRYEGWKHVFDWVTQAHTMVGCASDDHTHQDFEKAAQQIVRKLGLTPEKLREDIRGGLLEMWEEWKIRNSTISKGMRRSFQNDIATAIWFHDLVSNEKIDPYDEWWDPPDPEPRRWTRLHDALPYERHKARVELTLRAPSYLKRFNEISPEEFRFDDQRVKKLTKEWWPHGSEFRRFCISFFRLHKHYSGRVNEDSETEITVATPQDYLILCALHIEKFLSQQKQLAEPGCKAASVSGLILYIANAVHAHFFKLPGKECEASRERIRARFGEATQLHDLPKTQTNPFSSFEDAKDSLAFFETAAVNFLILRNYVAHHSCLDFEIIQSEWTPDPIESMLLVLLTGMEALSPKKNGK